MKTSLSFCVLALSLFFAAPVHAQTAFNISASLAPADSYAKVSLPASVLAELIASNQEGIMPSDACLAEKPTGNLEGYQADFDGDTKEEMWLLYHTETGKEGCNALVVVTPVGGGKYQMLDFMSIAPGKAWIQPIVVLSKGVQMYIQQEYMGPSGKKQLQGTVYGFVQAGAASMVFLTGWIQSDVEKDGAALTQDVEAAFFDSNFDGIKEQYLKRSFYSSPAKSEKSLVDQYVITSDYMATDMLYRKYDSSGFDKMKEASTLAKEGKRMLNKKTTTMDGITKIRESLRLNPFNTETRVYLGKFFLNSGRYGDAERALVAATEIDDKSPKAFMLLGDTYLRLNDLQKALAAYQKYLAFNPKGFDRRRVDINVRNITVPRGRNK